MVARRPRIALVSREVTPFGGGGIGRYVSALAGLLAGEFEVTIFTTSRHERAHRRAVRDGAALSPARIVFVAEPRSWDARNAYSLLHLWSARLHDALLAQYGGSGPELVEFCDFLGEGCVTAQARRTSSPALAATTTLVRLHGTAELYDVLDGFLPAGEERAFTHELERYALAGCDRLLWAGGDILGAYERFYGEAALAPALRVRHPFAWEGEAPDPAPPRSGGPLRMLYLGRLERRKGVRELIDALLGLEERDWRLTLVGSDTDTAPLGGSMRALLQAQIAGDERVELLDAVPRERVPELVDAHDALVVPSRWECWPYVALETLARGRPVIAPATGGLAEIAGGDAGFLAGDASAAALAATIAPLVAGPDRARSPEVAEASRRRFGELTDREAIAGAYRELAEGALGAGAVRVDREPPLVSIFIPYFEMERHIAQTVAAAAAQTHPRTELIVVNDGSFRPADEILLELEARHDLTVIAQPNSGLGAARNLGIVLSRGDYLLPLDADNLIDPAFVARCVAALEADPEIAYVTSWLRYIDDAGGPWKGTEEGLKPLGNSSRWTDRVNVAGDAVAVFRRSVFDAGLRYSTDVAGFEDWALYREMRRRAMIGHVIPEPLIGYRMREDSMMRSVTGPREEWARQAIEAHLAERALDWTAPR